MQGLYRSTGYWSSVEARKDWAAQVAKAQETGDKEIIALAKRLQPPDSAGHRRIDRALMALRRAMGEPEVQP